MRKNVHGPECIDGLHSLVNSLPCDCRSPVVLVCLGCESRPSDCSTSTPLSSFVVQQRVAADEAALGVRPQRCLAKAVCCITCATATGPVSSPERFNWVESSKFVILNVVVMVGDELQTIEGFMDTGADISIMSESRAKSLELDYKGKPPEDLVPLGKVKVEAIGFVPQLSLQTECGKHELENFYVVADDQMAEGVDCYLSLDLIQRFEHLVRLECSHCDDR